MIEVEKKFKLTKEQEKRLIKSARFLGEKTFTDIYYDNSQYSLTKNDIWLRARDGRFELKLPMQKNGRGLTNQYSEVEGEEKIRQVFGIVPYSSFLEDIGSFGYAPFYECRTVRKKYKKDKFTIDMDEAFFDNFRYRLTEIEIMVEHEKQIKNANDEILAFAKSLDLKTENVRGKAIEFLFREKPKHYKALVDAGVVVE